MYIDWNDVILRYPAIERVGDATEVGSTYIRYAENYLNGRLSTKFTVPFSSNNFTAKDLSIDITYGRIGNMKAEDREKFIEKIDDRINRLLNGEENMVADDGTIIAQTDGGSIWSTTQDYAPIFGFGDIEDFEVDPDLVRDENDART